jgi:hypothetical protein
MAKLIALAIFAMALWPAGVEAGAAGPHNGCRLPESDADALVILSNYYPGYWWDHTDLTIAVQWKLSLGSGQISRLTRLEGRRGNIGYDFATDDRYLYFTWREDEGDIWVMDVATDLGK